MQKIIQIYPCFLKLSHKQESVMDGQTDRRTDGQTAAITISPQRYRGGITRYDYNLTIMKSPKPANDCFRHHHVEELQTCSPGHASDTRHDEIVF